MLDGMCVVKVQYDQYDDEKWSENESCFLVYDEYDYKSSVEGGNGVEQDSYFVGNSFL